MPKNAFDTFCRCGFKTKTDRSFPCPRCGKLLSPGGVNPYSKHWTRLHSHRLCKSTAEWLSAWLADVPSYGCQCRDNVEQLVADNPPDYSGDHAWFRWGWGLHNYVSSEHADNPAISLDDAYSIHWPQTGKSGVTFVTALSLLPNHRAVQSACLDSWKKLGVRIVSVNTGGEIGELESLYPQVDCWFECGDTSTDYAYPTQKISNLIHAIDRLGEAGWIVNSDIELRGHPGQLRIPEDHVRIGIRWDHDGDYTRARQFEWGLDAFSFTPEQARAVPDSPYAIGQAMWDYWLPWLLTQQSIRFRLVYDRLFWHRKHAVNWNQAAWDFGAKYLRQIGGPCEAELCGKGTFRQSLDPTRIYDNARGFYVDRSIPEADSNLH